MPNNLGTVQAIRATYPTPLGAWHASFLIEVAQALGGKLYRKESGDRVILPNGIGVSMDILIIAPLWIDILQDAEGAAVPCWQEHPDAQGEFVDVTGMQVLKPHPDPQPDPEPDPEPEPGDVDLVALLTAINNRLSAIEDRLSQPVPVPLVAFPDYQGRIFGASFTLRPVK